MVSRCPDGPGGLSGPKWPQWTVVTLIFRGVPDGMERDHDGLEVWESLEGPWWSRGASMSCFSGSDPSVCQSLTSCTHFISQAQLFNTIRAAD